MFSVSRDPRIRCRSYPRGRGARRVFSSSRDCCCRRFGFRSAGLGGSADGVGKRIGRDVAAERRTLVGGGFIAYSCAHRVRCCIMACGAVGAVETPGGVREGRGRYSTAGNNSSAAERKDPSESESEAWLLCCGGGDCSRIRAADLYRG